MKKLLSAIITCGIALAGAVIILTHYSAHLDSEIARLYKEKENTLSLVNGSPVKDKGNIWIENSTKNNSIVIMGSSELSAPVSQNIKYDFPNTQYEGTTSCIGHANVQNGLHAMDLGANYKNLKDSDIVLIESIQWYFGDDIGADGFMSNFSELQFYEFLQNDLISKENKDYLCKRFLGLEKVRTTKMDSEQIANIAAGNPILNAKGATGALAKTGALQMENTGYDYFQTHLLAKLYISNNLLEKVLYQLMKPYYFTRYRLMSLKDKYNTYVELKNAEPNAEKETFNADWDRQIIKAAHDGKDACNNNDIFVYDDYYSTYLKDGWDGLSGSAAGTTALKSKEWDDFQFLLQVCNELGIKPYIINVSCNAYYYDYVGLDPDMRQEYYKKLSDVAGQYGISTYDGLTNKEYEPYVFADVMHLGWKGWIYVSKAITEHFNPAVNNINIQDNPTLQNDVEDTSKVLGKIESEGTRLSRQPEAELIQQSNQTTLMISQRFPDTRYAYLISGNDILNLIRGTNGYYFADIENDSLEDLKKSIFLQIDYDGNITYSDLKIKTMQDILKYDSVSSGVKTLDENSRKYSLETSVDGNAFNAALIQLENVSTGEILNPVLVKRKAGKTSRCVYVHNAPTGEYLVRLKGNSNLSDEYVQYRCELHEGETYFCNYNLETFDPQKLVVSGLYFIGPSTEN